MGKRPSAPRNTVVEKQNCGVSLGCAGCCSAIVTSRGSSSVLGEGPGSPEVAGSDLCRLDQRREATVTAGDVDA